MLGSFCYDMPMTLQPLLTLFLKWLSNPPTELLLAILRYIGQRLPQQGIYRVLDHHVTLELRDPQGNQAIYRKVQSVRFLQDHVIAFYDTAWGDGELFANYRCSPGYPVDRFRKGNRTYTSGLLQSS